MPLLSAKEVRNLKLSTIPLEKLRNFAESVEQSNSGSATDIIKRLIFPRKSGHNEELVVA